MCYNGKNFCYLLGCEICLNLDDQNLHCIKRKDGVKGHQRCHNKPFYSPRGRIGRMRYLEYNTILNVSIYMVAIVIASIAALMFRILGDRLLLYIMLGVLSLAVFVGYIYLTFVLAIRRLNDIGLSGWMSLLLPIISSLFVLYLAFVPGDDGENDYGMPAAPPTKGIKILALLGPLIVIFVFFLLPAVVIPAYQDYTEYQKQVQDYP